MSNARQTLDERFARGEISAAEYREMVGVLDSVAAGSMPPHRRVGFGNAVGLALRNYAKFRGRSSRAAYWYFVLATILLDLVTSGLDATVTGWEAGDVHAIASSASPLLFLPALAMDDLQPFGNIAWLLLFLPTLALTVRRLHDVGRRGWWVLIGLTIIGLIPLVFWLCQQGDRFTNRFGEDVEAGR